MNIHYKFSCLILVFLILIWVLYSVGRPVYHTIHITLSFYGNEHLSNSASFALQGGRPGTHKTCDLGHLHNLCAFISLSVSCRWNGTNLRLLWSLTGWMTCNISACCVWICNHHWAAASPTDTPCGPTPGPASPELSFCLWVQLQRWLWLKEKVESVVCSHFFCWETRIQR